MSGLFGTLNISTRGLFAQQRAIDTTSHNIANANTEGYSRQRVTLQTSRPQSIPGSAGQVGTGVDVSAVNRVRDSFLDYQVRVENGVNGQYTGRDKFLSQIENIMNEPTDTGISTLIGKFFDSWNTLATSAKESNARSIVAQQALALTNELNHTYTELEKLKENAQEVIKNTVFDVNGMLSQISQLNQQIKQVSVSGNNPNDLMDKRDLLLDQLSSKFGIKVDKKAFEGINVTTSADANDNGNGSAPLGSDGKTPLNITQAILPGANNATPAEPTAKFSYISEINPPSGKKAGEEGVYTVVYYKNGDMTDDANKVSIKVTLEDTEDSNAEEKFNQLNECRVLWANDNGVAFKVKEVQDPNYPEDTTKKAKQLAGGDGDASNLADGQSCDFKELALFQAPTGELKGYMSVQQDIETYEDQLNKLAKGLAFAVNGILSQSDTPTADVKDSANKIISANNFFVNADKKSQYAATSSTDTAAIANIDTAEQEITAANITINQAIIDNPLLIKTAAKYDENGNNLSGESDGSRALAVQMLRDRLMSIQDIKKDTKRTEFLSGILKTDSTVSGLKTISNDTGGMTIDSYFKDTVDRLGIQEQEARRMVDNQAKLLAGFKESRDSVSGVSLDEEMANLVQFQHCYQANAKIISTVDELLDVVINGLKR
ncbi:flagellar hook-associated protein FlgK [Clostridium magnum]|uniref:Flagellar hook-associated protein 1 n=1 Tax=Clostridium magnum DSM 2767 TaxID=1121326 RepID=A0A162ULP0_9CLOT|nr:flagellar hook-associated protein FlgK [Clostridium magnum]KZL94055.1 flagellar hook-associated protein 1 [Clostridium magnum DSM 2767]SHI01198.1 flagellar hook-associated protein 1 FlgK [Clostridium magnum DSM 2767]